MTIEEIRKNAPEGATHYIVIDDLAVYVMKKRFYHRWLHNGEFSQWMHYKPSLFLGYLKSSHFNQWLFSICSINKTDII